MATAPTNSSDSWEVRHVPGVDDASVPCPLISRCEKHSAHICCRHAFLPPSSLLPPFSGACLLSRTDFFEGTGERAWSSPIAALRDLTLKRAHVMSCLIHDSRLTSATIDLGHTLPPCLSPYLATAALLDQASSLVVAPPCDVHACIYASMHHALMVNLG